MKNIQDHFTLHIGINCHAQIFIINYTHGHDTWAHPTPIKGRVASLLCTLVTNKINLFLAFCRYADQYSGQMARCHT